MDYIDSDNEFSKKHERSREELISNISEEALKLIHALDIQREPDSENNTYTFGAREGNYQIPESVSAVAGRDSVLEDFTINFTRDNDSEVVSAQVCFIYRLPNDKPSTFILTHNARPGEAQYYSMAQLIGTDGEPLPHFVEVPSSEISRLFASIAIPSKSGDFSVFNSADHNQSRVLRSFDEALEKHSSKTLRETNYWLEDSTGQLTRIQYDTENATPISITFVREDERADTRMATSIDFQPGSSHEYADEEMVDEADSIHMMIGLRGEGRLHNPTVDDLIVLNDVICEFTQPFTVPIESYEDMDRRGILDKDPFDD